MENIYIPSDRFDHVTTGLAARLNDGLSRCMVSGKFEPYQIAEILADFRVLPVDVMRRIIIDQNADARRDAERMASAVTRPVA